MLLSALTFSVGFGVFCSLFMRVGREGGLPVFRKSLFFLRFFPGSSGSELNPCSCLSLVCFSCHLGSPHSSDLVSFVGGRALTTGFSALDTNKMYPCFLLPRLKMRNLVNNFTHLLRNVQSFKNDIVSFCKMKLLFL